MLRKGKRGVRVAVRVVGCFVSYRSLEQGTASRPSFMPRPSLTANSDRRLSTTPPPDQLMFGRVLRDGSLVEITGPRHASLGAQGTPCGLPASREVLVGVAFSPDTPGACDRYLVTMLERQSEP